jgi:beta-glucuronidase
MIRYLFACLLLWISTSSTNAQTISLNGPWSFAIDPMNRGEASGWDMPWTPKNNDASYAAPGFDVVTVPHVWSLDTRYNHIGKSGYRKGFTLPAKSNDKLVRLRFESVFYKCRVFLNGQVVAYHSGGYTPFTIDVTTRIKYDGVNFLSVEVDNSWSELNIPGGRLGDGPNQQLYPWYDFGGITRDVSLLVTDKVFIENQKLEAKPNLQSGTAQLKVITWVHNKSDRDATITLRSNITNRTTGKSVQPSGSLERSVTLKAATQQKIVMDAGLAASDVLLWDFDNPNLYDVASTVKSNGTDLNEYNSYFGIREFKVDPTQPRLLLNGNPVRVAGANRHADHPVYGSTEPEVVANEDMALLRNGNMIMSRLNHTPTSKHFLKWADEHGYLIFAEVPNWQIPPVLMGSQLMKDEFRRQAQEMVEAFWNSPSIVAYSTGNEYESWTPEGDEWTRYQMEQYKLLDTTRLLTFISIGNAANPNNLATPHDGYRHCDFINYNNYSAPADMEKSIERIHGKYPNLPIVLSEFGLRADFVKNEQERKEHLEQVVDILAKHPYMAGCSYWSFNDYLSRFTATNKNGYREWGIIDPQRKPRGIYQTFQAKLSPVTVNIANNKITVGAKSTFPSYTLRNYVVKVMEGDKLVNTYPLPELKPGGSAEIKVGKMSKNATLVIENKQGIRVYDSSL